MAQDFKCDPQSLRDLRLVRLALAEFLQAQSPATEKIEVPSETREFFVNLGKRYGGRGGYARARSLSAARRREIALKAGLANKKRIEALKRVA